jgi:hypothetical protein
VLDRQERAFRSSSGVLRNIFEKNRLALVACPNTLRSSKAIKKAILSRKLAFIFLSRYITKPLAHSLPAPSSQTTTTMVARTSIVAAAVLACTTVSSAYPMGTASVNNTVRPSGVSATGAPSFNGHHPFAFDGMTRHSHFHGHPPFAHPEDPPFSGPGHFSSGPPTVIVPSVVPTGNMTGARSDMTAPAATAGVHATGAGNQTTKANPANKTAANLTMASATSMTAPTMATVANKTAANIATASAPSTKSTADKILYVATTLPAPTNGTYTTV